MRLLRAFGWSIVVVVIVGSAVGFAGTLQWMLLDHFNRQSAVVSRSDDPSTLDRSSFDARIAKLEEHDFSINKELAHKSVEIIELKKLVLQLQKDEAWMLERIRELKAHDRLFHGVDAEQLKDLRTLP
jgi:hypothetical protein